MIIFKKLRYLLVIITCLIAGMVYAETLDHVVAIVNDDVITQSALRAEMKTAQLQLRDLNKDVPSEAALRKQALNHLIDKTLQLQLAVQLGLSISDKELNAVIGRIATQNNMTTELLLARLQDEGMNVAFYKNTLRDQLLIQKVQQQEIASKVSINHEEVERLMREKHNKTARKQIENQLLQEKFEIAGKQWLSRLRALAYVEIKKV